MQRIHDQEKRSMKWKYSAIVSGEELYGFMQGNGATDATFPVGLQLLKRTYREK